ncbi:GNAT family N-acetyltransferase [Salimicrobium flavidum]|uniref:Acetyltransferase (GNAT) family protein n=1 Tax=Salimicrobium flavidum TaxID=570947 RepID=A0A1N7INV5_9BACI|nr:GNAT family N-acetyltransferase [Salimicrobium flavidum]SIS38686.1 Acetyltransferase (GNAT) family protein [Salimicrobium flavidum]
MITPCAPEEAPIGLLLEADPSRKHIEDYVERGTIFVATEKEEIIGVYVILPTRPGTLELVNIAVEETHRGKGIGRCLIRHAIDQAEGYQRLEVGTGNSSVDQLAFYQRAGFRIDHVDHDFFTVHYNGEIWENGIRCRDMIRLVKTLETAEKEG